jgi:sugar/nucleoside kinase (ribokinase family)
MSLVVVGSIAFDSVETPFGARERMLGGSAVHFSLAASFFSDVRVVGPVGDDFGDDEYAVLQARGVDTSDIERRPGETFFWAGRYEEDLNTRVTEETRLGVFEDFRPKLSAESRSAEIAFLGNIQPELQRDVRAQCTGAQLVALDSMNLWIDTARESLVAAIREVDVIVMDEVEVRMLTGESNLLRAAREVMALGPHTVVAKQGDHGVSLYREDEFFALPAFPLETVSDPTGAGDCFAGGFLGSLAAAGSGADGAALRRATAYGSVLGSFCVEEFGTERLQRLTREEIDERYAELQRMTALEAAPA